MIAATKQLHLLVTMAVVSGLAACESKPSALKAADARPAALIQDQVHNDGTVGFYFLPPMVSSPTLAGVFDATLSPTVRITEIADATTSPVTLGAVIAEYSVSAASDHYQVNWNTRTSNFDADREYRITVSVGDKLAGTADVIILANASGAKNVNTGDLIPLVDNQTLPIKFWMNSCAPVVCGACAEANSCDPSTGACVPKAQGTVCRAAAGECDVAATCDGASNDCPANQPAALGTACSSDGNYCTQDICDGQSVSCSHPEAAGVCARDWVQFPSVAEVDTAATEMFVMSDIHGDYTAYTNMLYWAGVISAIPVPPVNPNVDHVQDAHGALGIWNAGDAVMVIVGDLINKGPDSVDVIRLTMALQASAAAAGGHVVATLGNHEAEFLGDQGAAAPVASKAFDGLAADGTVAATYNPVIHGMDPELRFLFQSNFLGQDLPDPLDGVTFTPAGTAAGNNDVGAFIHGLPFAARVNDWFFVHGGKTGGQTIDQIRLDVQSKLDSRGWTGKDGALTTDPSSALYPASLVFDNGAAGTMLEARLAKTPAKVQWWDPVSTATGATATANAVGLLTQWTQALGVRHIAMGHQPAAVAFLDGSPNRPADTIFQYPNASVTTLAPGAPQGLIFLVDTGMSAGNDSTGGGLMHVVNPGLHDAGSGITETAERWMPPIAPGSYTTTPPGGKNYPAGLKQQIYP